MGFLRFIFALEVFFGHQGIGYITFPAVESFFIISGFYMSLILNEKYTGTKRSYFLYLSNRFLRIYPSYWLILLLIFLLRIRRHAISISLHSFSFLSIQRNLLLFTNPYYFIPRHGYINYLNPPAWTLGIELIFYIVAPFFVRKKAARVFLLLAIATVLSTLLYDTKFFQVFYLFLLGSVSYVIYSKLRNFRHLLQAKHIGLLSFLVTVIFLALLFVFPHLLQESRSILSAQKVYYLGLALVIPFIFTFSAKYKLDRFFGDLSYPLYISHQIVLEFLWFKVSNIILHTTVAIFLESILVFFLYKFIDRPIQQYKQTRVRDYETGSSDAHRSPVS